jgi:hypothetical protein
MADIGFWQIWCLANRFAALGVIQKRVLQNQALSTFTILYPRNYNCTADKYALGKKLTNTHTASASKIFRYR